MPKVSVILPVYNPGSYLRPAVESVIAQTYEDWELLVIDDGSPEDISWVQGFHPKVTLLRQKNRGVSSARNFAIDRSSGELIAFIDQDDLWMPHKLAEQVPLMDAQREAVFCHSQMEFIDAAGKASGLGWGGGYKNYEELLDGCGVCLSSVLIRRDILFATGLFDPFYLYSQDYDIWLKAARLGPMIALANSARLVPPAFFQQLQRLRRHLGRHGGGPAPASPARAGGRAAGDRCEMRPRPAAHHPQHGPAGGESRVGMPARPQFSSGAAPHAAGGAVFSAGCAQSRHPPPPCALHARGCASSYASFIRSTVTWV